METVDYVWTMIRVKPSESAQLSTETLLIHAQVIA